MAVENTHVFDLRNDTVPGQCHCSIASEMEALSQSDRAIMGPKDWSQRFP